MKEKLTKLIKKVKYFLAAAVIIGLFFDIFWYKKSSDIITFGVIGLWIITSSAFKMKSRASFLVALILLLLAQGIAIFQVDLTPQVTNLEKIAVWVYLFLVIGAIKSIFELVKKEKNEK